MTEERRYWLMKTEPDVFSSDDLKKMGRAPWDGVRNFRARNIMMKGMKIGDEVLFVADHAEEIARIGLELAEERGRDEEFPEIRVGLAWGPALSRFGDVLGPVVNVASRLTSTSRPGRVLVDKALAEELKDREEFKLRRVRRTSVKGYRKLEPWSLQWSGVDDASNDDSS